MSYKVSAKIKAILFFAETFKNPSMSILYRNVRFVLFAKTSIVFCHSGTVPVKSRVFSPWSLILLFFMKIFLHPSMYPVYVRGDSAHICATVVSYLDSTHT